MSKGDVKQYKIAHRIFGGLLCPRVNIETRFPGDAACDTGFWTDGLIFQGQRQSRKGSPRNIAATLQIYRENSTSQNLGMFPLFLTLLSRD